MWHLDEIIHYLLNAEEPYDEETLQEAQRNAGWWLTDDELKYVMKVVEEHR